MILLSLIFYVANLVVLPLLLIGTIQASRARLQNRQGPSPLQPFYDVVKLLRKGETISQTATWAFRSAPTAQVAVMVTVGLMVPWLGVRSPIPGDLFLVIYLMALGKFCASLSALDTGSSFGAIGASREAAIGLQAEPAMVLGLAALAARAHTSSFAGLLMPGQGGVTDAVIAVFVVMALGMASIAELSRMPVDDPTTHLELTMIHEAQILENSGRNLALTEYASAVKMAVLLSLVGQVALTALPHVSAIVRYAASLGLLIAGVAVVAVAESVLVKLRWRRLPNLLSFAIGSATLACLLVSMGGGR